MTVYWINFSVFLPPSLHYFKFSSTTKLACKRSQYSNFTYNLSTIDKTLFLFNIVDPFIFKNLCSFIFGGFQRREIQFVNYCCWWSSVYHCDQFVTTKAIGKKKLKLENSLRWSFFTFIYNRSSNELFHIFHIISLLTGDMSSINWPRSQCAAS